MSFPRYPEYKKSGVEWHNSVPKHWELGPLKHFYQIIGGSTPKSDVDAYWNGSILWVTPADLSKISGFNLNDSERTITELGLNSCGTYLVPAGSIVLSTRAPIGTLGIAMQTLCTNQGCKSLIPKNNQNSKFLAYLLRVTTKALNIRGRGTTFLELSTDDLGSFQIPVPTLLEQFAIVNFLDQEITKIDSLISEQEKLIELLKEKRQAVISHAVTKGLDPNVKMKDSGVEWLGQIPENWTLPKLKSIATFSGGGTPSRDKLEYWNGDIPWVSPKDMKTEKIENSEEKITQLGLYECSSKLHEIDSVLLVVRSGILKHTIPVAINTVNVSVNQDLKALYFDNSKCLNEYFLRWVQGNNNALLLEWAKQGATVESIEHNYLANTLLPLPPINEQRKIIDYLNKLLFEFNQLISESAQAITLLFERRSALISSAVTGQIDVRNVAITQEAA